MKTCMKCMLQGRRVPTRSLPQTLEVIFETSYSDAWVLGVPADGHQCCNHQHSSTYAANGSAFVDPVVAGFMSSDVWRIGGAELENQLFAEVTDVSRLEPFQYSHFDGVLGLGFETASLARVETPFYRLVRQGELARPVFGFFFGRDGHEGELTLGEVDETHLASELHFVDVASEHRWSVRLERITVGERAIPIGKAAMVATVMPYVMAPLDDVEMLARAIGAKEIQRGLYSVDCDAVTPDITLVV